MRDEIMLKKYKVVINKFESKIAIMIIIRKHVEGLSVHEIKTIVDLEPIIVVDLDYETALKLYTELCENNIISEVVKAYE